MSNYHLQHADKPQALTPQALRSLRQDSVQGISRRTLLRRSIILVDPSRQEFVAGEDTSGDGTALNVRALYQRCPHLGCKPKPCLRNFWLECPCHGSRYDRLGIKAAGAQYGPAPRSMDRFSAIVDAEGVLTVDTGKITLGPLPIPVGQPGIIPPQSPVGCI
jgi:Rieske Fe-S protein